MHPFLFFIIALLTPFGLCLTLFVLPYAAVAAASYIVYSNGTTPHPLADKLYDIFYIMDVYGKLFSYGKEHLTSISVLTYALPVFVLPVLGIMGAGWLTKKYVRKMSDVFHITVGEA